MTLLCVSKILNSGRTNFAWLRPKKQRFWTLVTGGKRLTARSRRLVETAKIARRGFVDSTRGAVLTSASAIYKAQVKAAGRKVAIIKKEISADRCSLKTQEKRRNIGWKVIERWSRWGVLNLGGLLHYFVRCKAVFVFVGMSWCGWELANVM